MEKTAVISDDGLYRYELTRRWAEGPSITWVMLNPSTADDKEDDNTIRRCISFSKKWSYGALTVVNLYAYRVTDPKGLTVADDPIGPENYDYIARNIDNRTTTIAAWGAHVGVVVPDVLKKARLYCLGKTKAGSPKHPLYVPGDQWLERWP